MKQDEFADNFVTWLMVEKGFPQNVLRREFGVIETSTGKTLETDLVVLDPHTSGFTAVFEFVGEPAKLSSPETRRQLLRYRSALGKVRRAAYLVGPSSQNGKGFVIHQVFDDDAFKEIPQSEFPDFQALLLGETAKSKAETDQETDDTVGAFNKWCWGLSAAVVVVLILDLGKLLTLSAQHLALIGLAVGLALAPYAAKFKFLGIEWERYNSEKDKGGGNARK